MTRTKLIKLSICPCGFPLLREDIPLGAEYVIDPGDTTRLFFKCGGCGREQSVEAVFVAGRPGAHAGYLPLSVFEYFQEKAKA